MTETASILAKVGQHPSNRTWLRFESGAWVWTSDRSRALHFVNEVYAFALVDPDTGPAFEGGVAFETETVTLP